MWICRTFVARSTLALLIAFAALPAHALDIAVDFGIPQNASPNGWNDARHLIRSGTLSNLKTTMSTLSGYSLTVNKGFTNHQPYGTTVPASYIPLNAARDGMYGNELPFQNYSSPTGELELKGLNPAVDYTLKFFASVAKAGDNVNRTTNYQLIGASSPNGNQNPTNNTGGILSLTTKPTAAGSIRIIVKKGPGNATKEGFYHIGHFVMSYTLPTANTPPVVNPTAAPSTLALPTKLTVLKANASDPGGSVASYLWTKTSGPSATFSAASSAQTNATLTTAGTYVFNVRVTDNLGAITNKTVSVVLNPAVTQSAPGFKMVNVNTQGNKYGYVEYLPRGYQQGSNYPLIIFLHGIGERGTGTRDPNSPETYATNATALGNTANNIGGTSENAYLNRLLLYGPNEYIRGSQVDLPFVILSIQQFRFPPAGSHALDWNVNFMDEFLTYALDRYKVDETKVHLTGLSLGGGGSLHYALVKGAHRLASLVPICQGYYNQSAQSYTDAFVNRRLAIWTAHAYNDVPAPWHSRSRAFVNNMGRSIGGPSSPDILYDLSNPKGYFTNVNPLSTTPPRDFSPQIARNKYTATYNESSKRWEWQTGITDRAPGGGHPTYPLIYTFFANYTPAQAGSAHHIWTELYRNPKLYEWMLRQTR